MTRERFLEITNLVLDVGQIEHIYASTTIGNTHDINVYVHDLRDHHIDTTEIFTMDAGLDGDQNGNIRYTYDPFYEEAEAYMRKLLQEAEDEENKGREEGDQSADVCGSSHEADGEGEDV